MTARSGTLVVATLAVLLTVTACAASGNGGYDVRDFRARWIDRFNVDSRACERAGGVIVQERYTPESLRIGRHAPEIGARYWCARP